MMIPKSKSYIRAHCVVRCSCDLLLHTHAHPARSYARRFLVSLLARSLAHSPAPRLSSSSPFSFPGRKKKSLLMIWGCECWCHRSPPKEEDPRDPFCFFILFICSTFLSRFSVGVVNSKWRELLAEKIERIDQSEPWIFCIFITQGPQRHELVRLRTIELDSNGTFLSPERRAYPSTV